jgi:hypothetical protein
LASSIPSATPASHCEESSSNHALEIFTDQSLIIDLLGFAMLGSISARDLEEIRLDATDAAAG